MPRFSSGQLFAERYQLVERLHLGGYTEVWKATDKLSRDATVVLKFFSPDQMLSPEGLEAFHLSFARLIPLQHPHLLSMLYMNVEQDIPFVVLPYCPNGSLRDRLATQASRYRSEEEILRMLEQISSALAYLHKQSAPVTHHHLSPEDILLSENGQYLLADFGRGDAFIEAIAASTGMPDSTSIAYRAPEGFGRQPQATPASDVFALGVIACEMATGTLPFDGHGGLGVTRGAALPAPPAHVSPGVWEMILRCLEADAEMRPTAEEIEKWARWYRKHRATTNSSDSEAAWDDTPRRSRVLTWVGVGVVAAAILLAIFGLQRSPNDAATPASPETKVLLRLQGSNTIGAEFAPALVVEYLKNQGATRIVRIPEGPEELKIRCTFPGEKAPCAVEIRAHGSSTAFEGLAESSADIGMASRQIKDTEAATLKSLGDMTSPACEHVLALDGIAVIVHRDNTLSHLKKAQIADIFAGTVANWKEVGGIDAPIRVYARDDKSGTYDTFKSLVLGKKNELVATAERFESNDQLRQIVANDRNGIGFVGLAYTNGVKTLAVSDGTQPIAPTPFSVATEDYPLARRLFLYTASMPKNPMARDFVEFALSNTGQDIANDIGFVGQNVELPVASTATRDPQRLNVNFRFYSGSAELDTKALRDLDRLVTLLQQPQYRDRRVVLYGYSDNRGDDAANIALSLQRAQAVARQLKERNIHPAVVQGRGAANPVASNDTPEGRNRNRRVEVWVK